MAYQQKVQ